MQSLSYFCMIFNWLEIVDSYVGWGYSEVFYIQYTSLFQFNSIIVSFLCVHVMPWSHLCVMLPRMSNVRQN